MSDNPTPKRKTRTPEERKAALLAQVEELEAKQRVKDEARLEKLKKQHAKTEHTIRELTNKQIILKSEIDRLTFKLREVEPNDDV